MKTYLKNIGMIFVVVLWFFGAQYSATYLMMGLKGTEYVREHTFYVTLLSYLICLIPYVAVLKQPEVSKSYRLNRWTEVGRYVGYGVLLWLGSCIINGVLLPFFPNYNEEIGSLFVTNEPFLRFLVLVVGAPFIEEYLFRGKIQERLNLLFGPHLAVIGQGLIFGLIHPFGLQKVYASFLGIGLGYIRQKNQTLIGTTIMHMTINGIAWMLATFVA